MSATAADPARTIEQGRAHAGYAFFPGYTAENEDGFYVFLPE
jgi:hypothetical protein